MTNEQTVAENPEKRKRGTGTGGNFFVLDKSQWEKIWDNKTTTRNRLNLAVAYLVMMAGTGADHSFTKWSAAAIRRYTAMNMDSGHAAIQELIARKLAKYAPSSTRPRPHYLMATAIKPDEAAVIFLPVALVTGLGTTDTSMLHRIRETGDALLLRLLIDLYGQVTTDAPFALGLGTIRTYWDKTDPAEKAREIGAHTIWHLAECNVKTMGNLDQSRYTVKGEEKNTIFWNKLKLLETVGAIYYESWLFNGGEIDADPLFPMTKHDNVADWADTAARRLLTGPEDERHWLSEQYPNRLVAPPTHHQKPALQLVAKMMIEADTPGRRGAFGERSRIMAHWLEQYGRLLQEAEAGRYDNPVRTQVKEAVGNDRTYQGNQGH